MTPGSMSRRSVAEMATEFLREAAVLVFVFSLVEKVLEGKPGITWALSAFAVAGVFLSIGIAIERRRKE